MTAVLPADVFGDEVPSGFSLIGHVGRSTTYVILVKALAETDFNSAP